MSQLIVRKLDGELVRALRRRAARHGRSAEAEHRAILREALAGDMDRPAFKDFLTSMPNLGTDEELVPPRELPREVTW